jgi:hypothetical protein
MLARFPAFRAPKALRVRFTGMRYLVPAFERRAYCIFVKAFDARHAPKRRNVAFSHVDQLHRFT